MINPDDPNKHRPVAFVVLVVGSSLSGYGALHFWFHYRDWVDYPELFIADVIPAAAMCAVGCLMIVFSMAWSDRDTR